MQLPPIYDRVVLDNSSLDGRPDFSPSHFKENFKICYLTEKMRNTTDLEFSHLCDRVAVGQCTPEDLHWLQSRVQDTESEQSNENFKLGKLSIIVTTNKKRQHVNEEKLAKLLPGLREYSCNSIDRAANVPTNVRMSENEKTNMGKTGNLPTTLKLKVGAPCHKS